MPSSNNGAVSARDLHFLKESNHVLSSIPFETTSKSSADTQLRPRPLRSLSDISGFSVVFLPGASPSFIFKTAVTAPHIIRLRGDYVYGLSGLHVAKADGGFAYLDSNVGNQQHHFKISLIG